MENEKQFFRIVNENVQLVASTVVGSLAIDKDKPWTVTVTKEQPKRTILQNNKIHAMIRAISMDTGNEFEWLKNKIFKDKGFMHAVDLGDGDTIWIREEVHKMTLKRGSECIEAIYEWCGERGLLV